MNVLSAPLVIPDGEELMDRRDVARMLGRDPITIWNWGKAGVLTRVQVGSRWKYPRSAVLAMMNTETKAPDMESNSLADSDDSPSDVSENYPSCRGAELLAV